MFRYPAKVKDRKDNIISVLAAFSALIAPKGKAIVCFKRVFHQFLYHFQAFCLNRIVIGYSCFNYGFLRKIRIYFMAVSNGFIPSLLHK